MLSGEHRLDHHDHCDTTPGDGNLKVIWSFYRSAIQQS